MPPTKKKEEPKPPWMFNGKSIKTYEDMPEGVIGFVYRIENKTTGKYYIGRKTVAGIKKKKLTKKEKAIPENSRKTFKREFSETKGWQNYFGSNIVLKDEVKNGHEVTREILIFCFTKAQITFEETKHIICGGALEDENSYNGWIKCLITKEQILKK